MHATIPSVEFVVLLSKEFVTYAFVELRYEVSQNEYSTNQLVFMYNIQRIFNTASNLGCDVFIDCFYETLWTF